MEFGRFFLLDRGFIISKLVHFHGVMNFRGVSRLFWGVSGGKTGGEEGWKRGWRRRFLAFFLWGEGGFGVFFRLFEKIFYFCNPLFFSG